MYYPPSYLWHFSFKSVFFLYNFYSGVNFYGEKNCGNFIVWELIFADREKNRKNRKNLVPHGKFEKTPCQNVVAMATSVLKKN